MRTNLVEMHKNGCPWKSKQCEGKLTITRPANVTNYCKDSIYRVPLQTPSAMTRELKARAAKLDLVIKDIQIKHPLVSLPVTSSVNFSYVYLLVGCSTSNTPRHSPLLQAAQRHYS